MDPALGRFVVMGVSGAGKSRLGAMLAEALGGTFIDADDLHPPANRAKMAAGTPLDDADRWPWLDRVAAAMAAPAPPVVVACSALRRRYRDRLRQGAPGTVFLHLAGSPEAIEARLRTRRGHFMPPSLLRSQIDTLEPLGPDEAGLMADTGLGPPDAVLAALLAGIDRLQDGPPRERI